MYTYKIKKGKSDLKRKIKLLISAAVTASLAVWSPVNVFSEGDRPCLTAVGGYAAENDITTVSIFTDTELNLAAYSISLNYDPSMLEFINAYCGTEYGSFYPDDSADDRVTLVWSDGLDRVLSGQLFTVAFKTKSRTAEAVIPVDIGHSVLGSSSSGEIPFDAVGCEISVLKEYMRGDTNCDGRVSVSDAAMATLYNINSDTYSLSEKQYINSDMDNNGIVNSKDAQAILSFVIGAKEEL